jgi:hypothetical protein
MSSAPTRNGRWLRTGVPLRLTDGRTLMLLSTDVDHGIARVMWLSPDRGKHTDEPIEILDGATEEPKP